MAKKQTMKDIILSETSIIRVEKKEYKEKTYLDVRKMYAKEGDDEWHYTSKGIMIPIDQTEAVLKAMNAVK